MSPIWPLRMRSTCTHRRGAAALRVPVPAPSGRGGLGPALTLTYGAAAGNSTFGAGWRLAGLPSIGIDTRKRLQRWDGTDGYALDDDPLVPWLEVDTASGARWRPRRFVHGAYAITVYRSRTGGATMRSEPVDAHGHRAGALAHAGCTQRAHDLWRAPGHGRAPGRPRGRDPHLSLAAGAADRSSWQRCLARIRGRDPRRSRPHGAVRAPPARADPALSQAHPLRQCPAARAGRGCTRGRGACGPALVLPARAGLRRSCRPGSPRRLTGSAMACPA